MRILLAFEYKHTTVMDAVQSSIRKYHSYEEVMVTVPEVLEAEINRFKPHLLVCEPPVPENPGGELPAYIELAIDPSKPSRFCVGGERWESLNPGIGELMSIVAATERLISSAS